MTWVRRIAIVGLILAWAPSLRGQRPAPIADRPEISLTPASISDLPVTLSGRLAYLFHDPDGTEAIQLSGNASVRLGDGASQVLSARELVVWLSHRMHENRRYLHLDVFLWRDAEILESGGTATSGPMLFVTLDTFGPLTLSVDEFGYQSAVASPVYIEGNAIRKALAAGTGAPGRVFDPTGEALKIRGAKPRPIIQFQSRGEFRGPFAHDGYRLITVLGRIYLSRGVPGSDMFLEIQADSAVVFLTPEAGSTQEDRSDRPGLGGRPKRDDTNSAEAPDQETADPGREAPPAKRPRSETRDRQVLSTGFGDVDVQGAYLDGDVLMTVGANQVRATRLYYDFIDDRAVILDAVVRTTLENRNVPLYLRAAEVRQLSAKHFVARDAVLTTSEFHTPHYHIGASRVELINRTAAEPGSDPMAIRAGTFRIRDATLNVYGVPVAYWPSIQGTADTSESAIRSLRLGYSSDFGAEVETEWHLFNVLGLEDPAGFDGTLHLDYFSERGPGVGVDLDYKREKYYGLLRGYLMYDDGEDFLGRERRPVDPPDVRGRFLTRHREFLEDDWQLTLELSYISDESFLEEYYESEFDNDKDQETLLHLKKQRDNWAFTSLLQYRILDFTTQTERLPDLAYFRLGEPLWDGRMSWYSENRLGLVRYRPQEQDFFDWLRYGPNPGSGTVARGDTRQELGGPVDVGPLRFVPFGAGRLTAWSDSPDEGSLARVMGLYGVRGSMYLWRVYPDAQSTLFDVQGVRHVIKTDFTAWGSHTNVDSHELFPFDQTVENINEVDGVTVGVRQRFQTKRGEGPTRRNVDVVTIDTELGVFNDGGNYTTNGFASFSRPENSIDRNYVANNLIWRINDRTSLLNEINVDLNDASVDFLSLAFAVERTPRFNYILGYRYIGDTDSNLIVFDVNYRMTEKHTIAIREAFDLDRGRILDSAVALIRKHPRWYTALTIEVDESEDDVGVSFTLWPEGLSRASLGSRRFTGLATSTVLAPSE